MKTFIITSENYGEIQTICAKVKSNAFASEQKYSYENLIILGRGAIERYLKEYAPGARIDDEKRLKTDGKTTAEILPYLFTECHFDARINAGGINRPYYVNIYNAVKFNGVLYQLTYNKDRAKLYYLNDDTDYYNYLPYRWDDEHPAPAQIGTFTDKKLSAWASYLAERRNAAESAKAAKDNEVNNFLASVRTISPDGCDVYSIGETRGYIKSKDFTFSYEIQNGYISHRIALIPTSGGVEKFKQLINK